MRNLSFISDIASIITAIIVIIQMITIIYKRIKGFSVNIFYENAKTHNEIDIFIEFYEKFAVLKYMCPMLQISSSTPATSSNNLVIIKNYFDNSMLKTHHMKLSLSYSFFKDKIMSILMDDADIEFTFTIMTETGKVKKVDATIKSEEVKKQFKNHATL